MILQLIDNQRRMFIRVITKLPNSEQSYKGKVKTHNYTNRPVITIVHLKRLQHNRGTFSDLLN